MIRDEWLVDDGNGKHKVSNDLQETLLDMLQCAKTHKLRILDREVKAHRRYLDRREIEITSDTGRPKKIPHRNLLSGLCDRYAASIQGGKEDVRILSRKDGDESITLMLNSLLDVIQRKHNIKHLRKNAARDSAIYGTGYLYAQFDTRLDSDLYGDNQGAFRIGTKKFYEVMLDPYCTDGNYDDMEYVIYRSNVDTVKAELILGIKNASSCADVLRQKVVHHRDGLQGKKQECIVDTIMFKTIRKLTSAHTTKDLSTEKIQYRTYRALIYNEREVIRVERVPYNMFDIIPLAFESSLDSPYALGFHDKLEGVINQDELITAIEFLYAKNAAKIITEIKTRQGLSQEEKRHRIEHLSKPNPVVFTEHGDEINISTGPSLNPAISYLRQNNDRAYEQTAGESPVSRGEQAYSETSGKLANILNHRAGLTQAIKASSLESAMKRFLTLLIRQAQYYLSAPFVLKATFDEDLIPEEYIKDGLLEFRDFKNVELDVEYEVDFDSVYAEQVRFEKALKMAPYLSREDLLKEAGYANVKEILRNKREEDEIYQLGIQAKEQQEVANKASEIESDGAKELQGRLQRLIR